MVNLLWLETALLQAIIDRVFGEIGVMLYTGEPLLLGSRNNSPVTYKSGGTIVVVSGYPEDVHDSAMFKKLYR